MYTCFSRCRKAAGANGTSSRCYFQIKKINVDTSLVLYEILPLSFSRRVSRDIPAVKPAGAVGLHRATSSHYRLLLATFNIQFIIVQMYTVNVLSCARVPSLFANFSFPINMEERARESRPFLRLYQFSAMNVGLGKSWKNR